MRRGPATGRFLPHKASDSAPLFHSDEVSRAARVLSQAAEAKRKIARSAYVAAHVAAIRKSMGLD